MCQRFSQALPSGIMLLQLKVGLAEQQQQSETSWGGHELFSLTVSSTEGKSAVVSFME